jgi:hypothetical protein
VCSSDLELANHVSAAKLNVTKDTSCNSDCEESDGQNFENRNEKFRVTPDTDRGSCIMTIWSSLYE